MGTTHEDRLGLLKGACLAKIAHLEKELGFFRGKLKDYEEMEKEAAGMVQSHVSNSKKYASLGISEAAVDAVKILCASSPPTVAQVADHMLAHGYDPKNTDFKGSLRSTLKRIAKQGDLESKTENGLSIYWLKSA